MPRAGTYGDEYGDDYFFDYEERQTTDCSEDAKTGAVNITGEALGCRAS